LDRFLCRLRKEDGSRFYFIFPAKLRPPVYEALILAYSAGSAVEIICETIGECAIIDVVLITR
jgi:hypothetical protein